MKIDISDFNFNTKLSDENRARAILSDISARMNKKFQEEGWLPGSEIEKAVREELGFPWVPFDYNFEHDKKAIVDFETYLGIKRGKGEVSNED